MRKNIDMKFKNFKITDFTDIFGDLRYVRDASVVLKSGRVSFFKKLLILTLMLVTAIYIILPLDILPDLVPGFALIEDLVVGLAMFVFIGNMIGNEIRKIKAAEVFDSSKGKGKIVQFGYQTPPRDSGSHNKTN
ncbi:MAG: DUF1232 domain-containing protein [Proteocatella sp.]|nr:DUF1232 domain-containing protein [Proteocatella sp.]